MKKEINHLIKNVIDILSIPNEYYVGIVPGSDTGAVEIALWNLIGFQPVQMLVWDSFGNDWAKDLTEQLKVNGLNILKADYGFIPNFDNVNFNDDIIFNFNGTESFSHTLERMASSSILVPSASNSAFMECSLFVLFKIESLSSKEEIEDFI